MPKYRFPEVKMKNCALLFLSFFSLLLFSGTALAEPGIDFMLGAGTRMDKLDWNIAGDSNGSNPNVLSELRWRNLESYQLKARADAKLRLVYMRATMDYGWIQSGINQDSDYFGNNRTVEISRSNNRADGGNVWDATAGAGIRKHYAAGSGGFDIIPMIGVSYSSQDLRMTDGFQTIPPTGSFPGLDSAYNARWFGPWAGMDLIAAFDALTLTGSFEYHFLTDFRAEADWNLRDDFQHPVSFEHAADGSGVVVSLGADYALSKRWSVNAAFDLRSWQARGGTDRTFFSDGTTADTRLNEVNWSSYAFTAGVKYGF